MTDNNTEPTTEVEDTPEVENVTEDQGHDETNPNAEAAKYRKRLRETETQRDQLAAQVDALRTTAVDNTVEAAGIQPAAFWAAGNTLDSILDDDGNVDQTKVAAGIKMAVETLGVRQHRAPYVPKEGNVTDPKGTTNWENAFRG